LEIGLILVVILLAWIVMDWHDYFRDDCDEMRASLDVLRVMYATRVLFELLSMSKLYSTAAIEARMGSLVSDDLKG
jgi:hypothetical protein